MTIHGLSVDPSGYDRVPGAAGSPIVPPQLPRPSRTRVGVIALAVATSIVVALALVMVAQAGRVLPGTSVVGVEIGGLDAWGTRRVLGPALDQRERRPLRVSAPGQQLLVRRSDLGLTYDVDATVAAALERGRSGLSAPLQRFTAPFWHMSIAPVATVDAQMLEDWVHTVADRLEREASAGDLTIAGDASAVAISGPHGQLSIDRASSIAALQAVLLHTHSDHVSLVAHVTLPPPTWPQLEALAERVSWSLTGPLILQHEERQLAIAPETLAELLNVRQVVDDEGSLRLTLDIPPERALRLLGRSGSQTFDRAAQDARIVVPDLPPRQLSELGSVSAAPIPVETAILPSQSRTHFGAHRTGRQLVAMILAGSRLEEADLLITEALLPTATAVSGQPTHLLGTFTTFHPAGAPRTENIRRLADILDDTLIAPGAEFSINDTSGPRSCADGFVPAGTIIRGELVDTCGGGVSQLGTTLMNAAFFAGLPLQQWQPHSFFIARYPAGREATLSYPDLDVRFLNDTEGFLLLRTSHTPDSITVSLYGRPRWSEVQASHGERRAPTPFSELVRETQDIPPGSRRVVQPGGDGFTVTVTRTRIPFDADDETSVERWTTVYRPQQRIVEIGALAVNSDDGSGDAERPAADGAAPVE